MRFSPIMIELCEIASENYPSLQTAVAKLASTTTKLQNAKFKRSKNLPAYMKAYQQAKGELDALNKKMTEISVSLQAEMGITAQTLAMMTLQQDTFLMKVSNVELQQANGKVLVSVRGLREDSKEEVSVILVDGDNSTNMELIQYPY